MLKGICQFYRKSPGKPFESSGSSEWKEEMNAKKWSVFLSITFGYGFYYVCRLSFNVVKKQIIDKEIFDATELGLIGSGLFFAYAFGKFANGVLADRVNVKRFMSTGLFVSAIANLILGFTTYFWFFFVLWTINGWFQSFGAPASVVSISRWTSDKDRGSLYGIWSSSHNIGEAITFVGTALIVSYFGWMWGFRVAGILCILVSLLIYKFLHERPEVYGLPSPVEKDLSDDRSIGVQQWEVFKNPVVWILALSSAAFYVTRYAVNSWGIFFLETAKGYSSVEAGSIISVNSIFGIVGTFFSGILSDKLFKGRRSTPAMIFGTIYVFATILFVFGPTNYLNDILSMILFGISLGVLLVYLGGLMVVDICSKEVSGTALGVVGIASYLGAGIQDILSGYLIEENKMVIDGQNIYDFGPVGMMWVGGAMISLILVAFGSNTKFINKMRGND